jgi:hypothetical protein
MMLRCTLRIVCVDAALLLVVACSPRFSGKGGAEVDASSSDSVDSGSSAGGAANSGGAGGAAPSATGGNQGAGGARAAGGAGAGGKPNPTSVLDASRASDSSVEARDGSSRCDERASPAVEPCLLDDKYAVFVKQGALGTGTKADPVGSIATAVSIATQRGVTRVIVCSATYPEQVVIRQVGAMALYGGFTCGADVPDGGITWSYAAGKRATVVPATGTALVIDGELDDKVIISDIDFRSADAAAGSSSIAAVVSGSSDVTLTRVNLTAGAGGNGMYGSRGDPGADGAYASAAFVALPPTCTSPPASQRGGYWPAPSECGSIGGSGGSAVLGGMGEPGEAGEPQEKPRANGGKPGTTFMTPITSSNGAPGNPGADGQVGAAANASGVFGAQLYLPADGNAGTAGHTGQGGGGGGGNLSKATCLAGGGEVGGMGGCGGKQGQGGGGGGASVALVSWDSGVTLQDAGLVAAKGGDGGNGGDGGAGGAGRLGVQVMKPSPVVAVGLGGSGGHGGNGGNGGSGSGGSGGPSYALVYHGTAPLEVGQTTLTHGVGGAGGKGGAIGADRSNPAPDGAASAAGQRFEVTP